MNSSNDSFKKPTSFIVSFDESTQIASNSTNTLNSTNNTTTTNNTTNINSAYSLQDAFKKYRDEKIRARSIYESNKQRRKSFRTNPKRMSRLRLKFVEQAKKFLGVPYAKKYFNPGTPEYNSKLFLDCCGLVRRVMRDLEDDFGFRIGNGNQNYMWDTLPIEVKKLEDIKPGDLVFISGIYFNPKLKKQPHGITHVEIMLGEGEKTIGARWNNGKVSIFDSYKFESKSFHSAQYYFRSLDPWLWGYCRSFCSKHPWRYNTVKPDKKSIFYTRSENERRAAAKSELSLNRPSRKNSVKSKKKKTKDNKSKLRNVKTAKLKKKPGTDKKENNNNDNDNNNVTIKQTVQVKKIQSEKQQEQEQQEQQEQQVFEDAENEMDAEEDEDAEAEVETQDFQDDDSDVQFEKKLSLQSSTENENDNNNCLDIKDVLRLLSECDDLNSEQDSICVQGNSDCSEDDLDSNFSGRDYQNYSRNSRRFEDDLYFQDTDYDDNNDIKISNTIENQFKELSIDNYKV